MTVASEISRLQCAKEDIRQSIINKGVDVCANITLDNYAACIDAISSGGGGYAKLKSILVGGGGGASAAGGGGGEVLANNIYIIESVCFNIGSGGTGGCYSPAYAPYPTAGTASTMCTDDGFSACARGGTAPFISSNQNYGGTSGSGCAGGTGAYSGGGGASGNGGSSTCSRRGGGGGAGICGYGGGGGAAGACGGGAGQDGGGNGATRTGAGGNASGCGGGGGGGYGTYNGNGGGGLGLICYPIDGSWGIKCSCGGDCCQVCDGYCIVCFTSNGTFTKLG